METTGENRAEEWTWHPPEAPGPYSGFFNGMEQAAGAMLAAMGFWFFTHDREARFFNHCSPPPAPLGTRSVEQVRKLGPAVFDQVLAADQAGKLAAFARSSFAFWEQRPDWKDWHSGIQLSTKEGGNMALHVFALEMRHGKTASTSGICKFSSLPSIALGHMRNVRSSEVAVFKKLGEPEAHLLSIRERNLAQAMAQGQNWKERARLCGLSPEGARKAAAALSQKLQLPGVNDLASLMRL